MNSRTVAKRREIYGEIARLTTKTLLLSFFDLLAIAGTFDHRKRYVRAYEDYLDYRAKDYKKFYQLLYHLKTQKIIEVYHEGKNTFIELTMEGRKRAAKYLFQDKKMPVPRYWDGKWRVVIFDIPEKDKAVRNIVRTLFKRVGFYQLQKSVYVYPHECIGLIRYLEETYDIDPYLQFIVADRLETEVDLITIFYEQGIIQKIQKKNHSHSNNDR